MAGAPTSTYKGYKKLSTKRLIRIWSKQIVTIQIGNKVQKEILQDRNLGEYIIANAISNYTNCYRVANNFPRHDKGLLKLQMSPELNSNAKPTKACLIYTAEY
jgi:hypothetical protein